MKKSELVDNLLAILNAPQNSLIKESRLKEILKKEKETDFNEIYKTVLASYKTLQKQNKEQVDWGLKEKYLDLALKMLIEYGDDRLLKYITKE